LSSVEATEIGSVRCSLIAATVQAYQRLLSACAQHLAAGVEDENPEIAEGEGATRLYNLTHGPQLFPFGASRLILNSTVRTELSAGKSV
jgi:hypothetical protein